VYTTSYFLLAPRLSTSLHKLSALPPDPHPPTATTTTKVNVGKDRSTSGDNYPDTGGAAIDDYRRALAREGRDKDGFQVE
jgi:hypothetical protein